MVASVIAAVVVLVAFGYLAIRGLLGEKEFLPSLTLGTAVAWATFITVLNLNLRASAPFGIAVPFAGAIVIAMGIAGAVALRRTGASRGRLDRMDLALLLIGAFPVSAMVLLYQFLGADGDYIIHYPVIAFFLKGYFPHFHPYFPELPLHGHYGRDLGLAGLLYFGNVGIGTAMIVEAWVLHLATLGNVYFLAKRTGAGPAAGAMAAYLAFFGVNAGFADWIVRSGVAEVMGNNNPVVHAFLFAILVLAATVVGRRGWAATLLLGVVFGGFDAVYETHFHIVLVALVLLCAAAMLPPWKRTMRAGAGAAIAVAVVFGLAVMLLSGGLTSRMLLSKVISAEAVAPSSSGGAYGWALAGAQQKVDVSFPKRPFLSLTHAVDGRPVPLFSLEFLRGQGLGFWLLPVAAIGLAIRRRVFGLVCASMAAGSILLPAVIDFGRFNGENFRYIFFAGLMAAICLGMLLGEGFALVTASGRYGATGRRTAVLALALIVWFSSSRARDVYAYAHTMALNFPARFLVTEMERLQHFSASYAEADEEATAYLSSHGKLKDRLVANFAPRSQSDHLELVNNAMAIMAGSRMPMVGFNYRIMRDGGGIRSSVEGWSGRATAFWASGDDEILRDLGADWLYVVPRWLPGGVAERLSRSPAIREAFRSLKGDERVVYRVERGRWPERPHIGREAITGLTLASREPMTGQVLEGFMRLPLRFQNNGARHVAGRAYVFYRVFDVTAGAPYDERDSVGTVHDLDVPPGREATLTVPFVLPYNPGDYDIRVFSATDQGDVLLGSFRLTMVPLKPS